MSSPTPAAWLVDVPDAIPAFRTGRLVAGRYQIVRFLARGGMGEVYEAFDTALREPVALKTVRPSYASDQDALRRFLSEVQLARRVTHRNVARVFDLGQHRDPGSGEVTFLTMELIAGETLHDLLRRQGRLGVDQALPIARQIAAGLEAAHRAGVVHRDLKPGNVMLAPEPGGPRAVVTDFGLAHPLLTAPVERHRVGTPAYMAPEQVEGGEIGPACDVYAFGVVLYEMVTGRLPFAGTGSLDTAAVRLRDDPPSPRLERHDLDPRWESAILRCLDREPGRRFASAPAVVDQLEPRRTHGPVTAAALLLLVLAAGFGALREVAPARPAPAPSVARRSLAVAGVREVGGQPEDAWLGTAIAELLASELGAGGSLRLIPGERVARAVRDLQPEANPGRLGRSLGADLVVTGEVRRAGSALHLDVSLLGPSGEALGSLSDSSPETELTELTARVGSRLRTLLGVPLAPATGLRAGFPEGVGGKPYAEGLARLRLGDGQGARRLLEVAARSEPRNALVHAALAQAWDLLGRRTQALEAARRAHELSGTLGREEKLSVEARYRALAGEWGRAVDVARSLATFFPDDLDYGVALADTLIAAGRAPEALAAVRELRRLPAAAEDPRVEISEADAAFAVADLERARQAARRAATKAEALGARALLALALRFESAISRAAGETARAQDLAQRALSVSESIGDRDGVARGLQLMGNGKRERGDLDEARAVYQRALAEYRALGNRRSEGQVLSNIAITLRRQGDPARALELYEEALAAAREAGERRFEGDVLNNIAVVEWGRGELARASQRLETALAIRRATADPRGEVEVLTNLADLDRLQGRLAAARPRLEEARTLAERIGYRRSHAGILISQGRLLLDTDEKARARAAFEQARAEAVELDLPDLRGQAETGIASVDLAGDRPAAAEERARGPFQAYESARQGEEAAEAAVVLAGALEAQGRRAEARAVVRRAQALAAAREDAAARLSLGIMEARLANDAEALRAARRAAAACGLVGHELEARLAQVRGSQEDARALSRDAEALGYRRIARLAR